MEEGLSDVGVKSQIKRCFVFFLVGNTNKKLICGNFSCLLIGIFVADLAHASDTEPDICRNAQESFEICE